jgi:hypothetical protein
MDKDVMDKFMLHFHLTERTLDIALSQITGKGLLPLILYNSWPVTDAWKDMKRFLKTQKWVSPRETFFILNAFTEVINYWTQGDPKVTRDPRNIQEKFPKSIYPNFSFTGNGLSKLKNQN